MPSQIPATAQQHSLNLCADGVTVTEHSSYKDGRGTSLAFQCADKQYTIYTAWIRVIKSFPVLSLNI